MRRKHPGDPAISPLWRGRKDPATYVISAMVLALELPVLAVLALAAVVSRAIAAAARLLRPARSEKIAN